MSKDRRIVLSAEAAREARQKWWEVTLAIQSSLLQTIKNFGDSYTIDRYPLDTKLLTLALRLAAAEFVRRVENMPLNRPGCNSNERICKRKVQIKLHDALKAGKPLKAIPSDIFHAMVTGETDRPLSWIAEHESAVMTAWSALPPASPAVNLNHYIIASALVTTFAQHLLRQLDRNPQPYEPIEPSTRALLKTMQEARKFRIELRRNPSSSWRPPYDHPHNNLS